MRAITPEAFDEAKRAAISRTWSACLPIEDFLICGGLLGDPASGTLLPAERRPVILDVRAPCEYAQGHIPGAISVPLFDDDERAEVGTLYKREGHDAAVRRGLNMIEAKGVESLLAGVPSLAPGDDVLVYCFRGGMRSAGVAELLSRAPLNVRTLQGGYKRFRRWAIDGWDSPRRVVMLSGKTGSGKTHVLVALRDELGAQVIDLEGEANHRGSAFGALGRAPQPSSEQFENVLALQWANSLESRPLFLEDESHNVGRCGVPAGLWKRMRSEEATLLRLEVPHASRVERLVGEYGVFDPAELIGCVESLRKRMGGKRADELVELLERTPPALAEVADALLVDYYDSMYEHQMRKRPGAPTIVTCDGGDALANAERILAEID